MIVFFIWIGFDDFNSTRQKYEKILDFRYFFQPIIFQYKKFTNFGT